MQISLRESRIIRSDRARVSAVAVFAARGGGRRPDRAGGTAGAPLECVPNTAPDLLPPQAIDVVAMRALIGSSAPGMTRSFCGGSSA